MTAASESPLVQRCGIDQSVAWNPLARPQLERDTIFLLDVDYEMALTAAEGQLTAGANFDVGLNHYVQAPPLGDPNSLDVIDGKYRRGLKSPDNTMDPLFLAMSGQFSLPVELPTDEFMLETWLRSDGATLSGTPLRVLATTPEGMDLMLGWGVTWNGPAPSTSYTIPANLRPAAGEWAHVACGLNPADSTINFLLNGKLLFTHAVSPHPEAASALLKIFWQFNTGNRYSLSETRLSRRYRQPRQVIELRGRPRITVDPTSLTGDTKNMKLLGGCHGLGNAYTIATMLGKLPVYRTDHFLDTAPIKAGGVDGTHPSLGHSGAYSYDWQVCDRTLDYLFDTLGATELYLSVDLTPQILGGTKPPASGSALTTKRTVQVGGETGAHPSSLTEFAKIVGDLIYHITVEKGRHVAYAGVWNEPQGGQLDGANDVAKRTYYVQSLYPTVANAIKAIDPTIKVGGPELAAWLPTDGWVDALVAYCQANAVPLDFISWHWYASNIGLLAQARRETDAICAAHGAPNLEFVIGEWMQVGTTLTRTPPTSGASFNGTLDLMHGAYGAAWFARALMEMSRHNVARACTYVPEDTLDPSFTPDGTLLASTHKWASFWVMELWHMLAADFCDVSLQDDRPGIDALAAVNGDQVDVLVAYQDYRNYLSHHVVLECDVPDGTPVTVYVVDDDRSNYKAGAEHDVLESYDGGTVENGEVLLTLQSRTCALVRIGT